MKRQKRKATPKKTQTAAEAPSAPSTPSPSTPLRSKRRSRRDLLQTMVYGAVGVAALGGGGWYFVSSVHASIVEQDLTRIGNGIPTVVQIHDPQCPRCRALQREARAAISALDGGTIQYLVANIRQSEGRAFAAEQGVGHVTLLLFDGAGERRDVLVGEASAEILGANFRRLIKSAASG